MLTQKFNPVLSEPVRSHLGITPKKFHDQGFSVGIEIEAEGVHLPTDYTGKFWRTVPENSLRQGIEYVLKTPLPIEGAQKACDEFEEIMKLADAEFYDSLRTSTHIHVNVIHLNLHSLFKVICASWLVESLLVHMHGPNRVGNLFCLRLQDADFLGRIFIEDIEGLFSPKDTRYGHSFLYRSGDQGNRYAATNLASIRKFGSVEYRFMKGMYTSTELMTWTKALQSLVANAVTYPTINEMADDALYGNATLFLKKLFGEFAHVIIGKADGHLREYLEVNQNLVREVCATIYKPRFTRPYIRTKDEDLQDIKSINPYDHPYRLKMNTDGPTTINPLMDILQWGTPIPAQVAPVQPIPAGTVFADMNFNQIEEDNA